LFLIPDEGICGMSPGIQVSWPLARFSSHFVVSTLAGLG
jgi:hypothetical protein